MRDYIIKENPFTACTARDMTYEEVSGFWCDPFQVYEINENELFSSRTPIFIEGARGTGKTMILKYLSYHIQKVNLENLPLSDKIDRLRETGVGVYFRYKSDFCNMFDRIDADDNSIQVLFRIYFELYICRELLLILMDIYSEEGISKQECRQISETIGIEGESIVELKNSIDTIIRNIDKGINLLYYVGSAEDIVKNSIHCINLFFRLAEAVSLYLKGWDRIWINVLLDEYENAWKFQRQINTMIKQVDSSINVSYRVGMRPAGISHYDTLVGENEPLQEDRDYFLRILTPISKSAYKDFALDVANKRLKSVPAYYEAGLTDLNDILGKKENIDEEANRIAKDERHFDMIKEFFPDQEEFELVKKSLSCDEKLMEMYNIMRVYRGDDYNTVSQNSKEYQRLKQTKQLKSIQAGPLKKYKNDYSSKYRMALLYLLISLYVGEKKQYYSVRTFLFLSMNSINDFISLCRNVFNRIDKDCFDGLVKGKIVDVRTQTDAAKRTADSQIRKITRGDKRGKELYTFINNMGFLFEYYHTNLVIKYPETNQFCFENESEIYNDPEANTLITKLLNQGVIVRDSNSHYLSVGEAKGTIYKFNHIFAPIYNFSYRTRGGFNHILNKSQFLAMFKREIDPKLVAGRKPSRVILDNDYQISIEDYLNGR